MAKVLVIYYSGTGNTKQMAESIVEGAKLEGLEAVLKEVKDVAVDELLKYDGIVIGQ